jgi:hypothetical protein
LGSGSVAVIRVKISVKTFKRSFGPVSQTYTTSGPSIRTGTGPVHETSCLSNSLLFLLSFNNANRPHNCVWRYGREVTNYASLIAADFHCFWPPKKHESAKRFATDSDVKQAVTSCLQTPYTDFFYVGIQAMMSLWYKCLNVSGDYVGIWCIPSATHVPCIRRSQNSGVGISVHLVFWNLLVTTLCVWCGERYAVD